MIGTIGKVIADNRKETSVFRALGAKRHEIAQIYLLYTGILATLSFLVALGIGLAVAVYVEAAYSPVLSVQAVLAFNTHDLHKTFHLIGFNALDLIKIFGFAIVVSLVSASVPIAHNLSRNPIKDMREE
jgi:ABC-type antimicrobial peptide transport system permease subunit